MASLHYLHTPDGVSEVSKRDWVTLFPEMDAAFRRCETIHAMILHHLIYFDSADSNTLGSLALCMIPCPLNGISDA